jgi:hypothetical protein
VPVLNEAFGTEPLSVRQWVLCVGLASTVLWAGELRKLVLRALAGRRRGRRQAPGAPSRSDRRRVGQVASG